MGRRLQVRPLTRFKILHVAVLAGTIAAVSLPGAVVAQQPGPPGCPATESGQCQLVVELTGGGPMIVSRFTPNSEVRLEVYSSPSGTLLYGPVTRTTNDMGGTAPTYYSELEPGNYVVATDVATATTKTLTVPPLTIDEVDLDTEVVTGTAGAGDGVFVQILGLAHRFDIETQADQNGLWTADVGAQSGDITPQSSVTAEVDDSDGDTTRTGPPPGCPAVHPGQTCRIQVRATGDDAVSTHGFTPNSQVRMEIYESNGGNLLVGPVTRTTDGTGIIGFGGSIGIDLVPGHHVVVTDVATEVSRSLEVAPLTIDEVDIATQTISGTASPGDEVWLGLGCTFPAGRTTADAQGLWSITHDNSCGAITDETFPVVEVFDDDFDSTEAQPEPGCPSHIGPFGCAVGTNVEDDSINTVGFTPSSEVTFEVYSSPGGERILEPTTKTTDSRGNAFVDFGLEPGPDIVAGNQVVVTDVATGTVKTHVVLAISITRVDPDTDVVEGLAPPNTPLTIDASLAPRSVDVTADGSGTWRADFSAFEHDVTLQDWYLARAQDEDADYTNDMLGSPIPGCVDDADTTCGSAAPDTIRGDDGEIISGLEDDTVLVDVGDGTDGVEIEPGPGDDGVVIGGDRRSFRVSATVDVGGSSGDDTTILPTHAGKLEIKVSGGGGADEIKTRDIGGSGSSSGRYVLEGGGGNDELKGGDGRDRLDGGRGRDVLNGGAGFDVCIGERGVDKFKSCERILDRRSFTFE